MTKAISGGTGERLTDAAVIVAGIAALVASLLSFVSIWLQTKNYRKPLLQRYVIRILLMVPIFAIASWTSIISIEASFYLDPIRDIYEAFTIYTFVQLLINFIGGERALIIMMHGRPPVNHLWPLNYVLPKVDISDPHTFLAIKRGILQYAWLKPILSLATIIMKATGTYQEGHIGLQSGYLWSSIFYNISITLSLYCLGLFWVCMHEDLQPFRPMPKFLCIKLIIFASYWQGLFLSFLVFLGAIPDDVSGYSPKNLSTAIQNALLCFEMPAFAVGHWYAFSWHDYADITISAARMPVTYALRDAFGIKDLIEDTKETFRGTHYEYRIFDSGDNVLAHEESASRVARMKEGMRYDRFGKKKYWLPKPEDASARTPLLSGVGPSDPHRSTSSSPAGRKDPTQDTEELEYAELDPDEENLYVSARDLEFGDWNYPVITAHEASRERWMNHDPSIITTSTNRNVLQPTKDGKARRAKAVQKVVDKGKHRDSSSSGDGSRQASRVPIISNLLRRTSSSSSASTKSGRSQLVDLVVEDREAEEVERVRARKEGGAAWNKRELRNFVRTYPDEHQGEEVRTGFEPSDAPLEDEHETHPADASGVKIDAHEDEETMPVSQSGDSSNDARVWERGEGSQHKVSYGSFNEERDAWDKNHGGPH